MVKIRLTRTGRKNYATFRVSITEARTKRDTNAIELVGYYLPHEKKVELNKERIQYWLSVGAQPSPTVQRLLVKEGLMPKVEEKKFAKKPGRKATERAAKKAEKLEAAKQAAAAPKEEAPAETTETAEPAAENAEAAAE